MKGKILSRTIFERDIFVYLPYTYDRTDKIYPVVYVQDGDTFQKIFNEIIVDMEEHLLNESIEEHIIVGIFPVNRLNEYTPWTAKANDKKFPDFGGQGDKYLEFLTGDLSDFIEKEFRVSKNKKDRKIMGHSLGALISLYSVFRNNDYGKIASLCASQWYDRWIEFIKEEKIINDDCKILFIAGINEGFGKATVQKDSPKFTSLSYEIFKKRIGEEHVEMIWDNYDHHENLVSRYRIALEFLMEKKRISGLES